MKDIVVCVSGGFDPVHIGHIRMFEAAKKFGSKLVVVVNNDNWLHKKKGYSFMEESERREILKSLACVDLVILTGHESGTSDMSVCKELAMIRPDIFANGGDRKAGNIPEYELCNKLDIHMEFNVGGGKVQSSSDLVARHKERSSILP